MTKYLLGLNQAGNISDFELYFRREWPGWVMLLVVLVAAGIAVALYRRESALPRMLRALLGVLRAVVFAIVLLMLFEPAFAIEMTVHARRSILMLIDTSESMGIKDPRKKQPDLEDAAFAAGDIKWSRASSKKPIPLPDKFDDKVKELHRVDLVKGILSSKELNLSGKLADEHQLLLFEFGDALDAIPIEDDFAAAIGKLQPTRKATALGSVLEESVARYGGQSIAGVILFTDGASNQGRDAVEISRKLKEQNIPVYPVGIGLTRPIDVRMDNLVVQEVLFKDDEVPIRMQVHSPGFEDREVSIVVKANGEEAARQTVVLSDRPQWVEIPFVPREGGTSELEISIPPLPDETLPDNNTLNRSVRVIDEKIDVLYIEGTPRWEYRYLRQVLKRDHRLNVKFIIAEGDPDLARFSPEYLSRFPGEAAEAFQFDLVILGDVKANYFSKGELERMEELVRERGGSFLMISGKRHAPAEYAGSVIEKILPVKLRGGGWQKIDPAFHMTLTPRGRRSSVVRLEADDEANRRLWQRVRPLVQIPLIERAKPGAAVLLHIQDADPRSDEPYPAVAWHRYGTGKSMFIATDRLWRLRFKTGDKYHARFWGQAIQFLTLSRLLGENKQISIQTDRKEYRTGASIQIYANVLDDTYTPIERNEYTVYLARTDVEAERKAIRLEPVPDTEGLYQGFYIPENEGQYAIQTDEVDRPVSNTIEFSVRVQSVEQLQPALQQETLQKIAELSGGRYFTIRDLPDLAKQFLSEEQTSIVRRERELWDLPIFYVLILLFAGTEWFLRRKYFLM